MNETSVRYTKDDAISTGCGIVPPVSVSRDTLCSLCQWRRSLILDAHQGTVCTTLLIGYACDVLSKKKRDKSLIAYLSWHYLGWKIH